MKLARLDEWNDRRRRIAESYLAGLKSVGGLQLPFVPDWADPVWHLFAVRHPQRDALQAHLNSAGIGTLVHYPVPPHRSEAYASDQNWGDLPIAESIANTTLSLPIGPHMEHSSVERLCSEIAKFQQ